MIDTIYRCEICGEESQNPMHWLAINCSSSQLTVLKWTKKPPTHPAHATIAAKLTPRSTSAAGSKPPARKSSE